MKWLQSKIQVLLRTGFFHIFGGNILNKIVMFASSVLLVRILTKSEYGIYTCAWNIYSMFLLINGCGAESGMLQLGSEHNDDETYVRRVCNYAVRYGLKFDLILAICIVAVGFFIPLSVNGANSLLVQTCLLPMATILYTMTTLYLRSLKKNSEYVKVSIVNTILLFVFTSLGALLFHEKGVVWGYYFSYLFAAWWASRKFRTRIIEDIEIPYPEDIRAFRSISFVSMCNNSLTQLLYLLDVFIIGIIVADETVLASYKVATLIPTALSFIPSAVVTYLYPYFAEHRRDGEWCLRQYKKAVMLLGGFNALLVAVLILFAPWIIRVLFGAQYMDSVAVFRILAINYFFAGTFRTLSGNLLVTQRKLRFNLFVALVSGSINVIADLLLIRCLGSMGAALATVIVVVLSGTMSTLYLIYVFSTERKSQIKR